MPQKKNAENPASRVWPAIRPLVIGIVSLALVLYMLSFGIRFLLNRYVLPVDSKDATPITVIVDKSDSASTVANKLYNACGYDEGAKGLISNKAVFKVYVDFVGKANKLQSGTYILSKNMGIPQIVDIICAGNPPKATLKFTVVEGYTIKSATATAGRSILHVLEQAGLTVDETEFLALCNDRDTFEKFDFIAQIPKTDDRRYLLEGYLFPDTYEAYIDAGAETIINRMLLRFNNIFSEEYVTRAQELNMTIDEVVTLASMIEREAAVEGDFAKVSAVFHNRLKAEQKLESCATLQYVHLTNKYEYNAEERATPSPYNTYLYAGLPAGPVCNPGKRAIEAALWPNEEYLSEDYRFFCNMELPRNKALAFAKTLREHEENLSKYRKYWS